MIERSDIPNRKYMVRCPFRPLPRRGHVFMHYLTGLHRQRCDGVGEPVYNPGGVSPRQAWYWSKRMPLGKCSVTTAGTVSLYDAFDGLLARQEAARAEI